MRSCSASQASSNQVIAATASLACADGTLPRFFEEEETGQIALLAGPLNQGMAARTGWVMAQTGWRTFAA